MYVHILFLSGLVLLDVSWADLAYSFLFFILIVSPISAVILHNKFKHEYVEFSNSIAEWFGLLYICIYSFWKSDDFKSYHILHHKAWLTDNDPTAVEIRQGKLRYYVGLTDPCPIPKVHTNETWKVDFMNHHFWTIKGLAYLSIVLLFGLKIFYLTVIVQQLYNYVHAKIHDMVFHSSDHLGPAKDVPWLFPFYFNSAWHIDHHSNYSKAEDWRLPWINAQYLFTRLLVKDIDSK